MLRGWRARLRPRARWAIGRVVEERFVDCPWWPDLFVSAGETLLSMRTGRAPRPTAHAHDWGPDAFPFAEADRPPGLRRALRRHPTFDRAPPPLAGLFAHTAPTSCDAPTFPHWMDLAAAPE